jgi:hypothetical protein
VSTISVSRPPAWRACAPRAADLEHAVPCGAVCTGMSRLRPSDELLDGGRAVRVGGDEQRPAALLDQVACELGRRRRLARALQADEQHTAGEPVSRNVRSPAPRIGGQLLVHDLDHLLAGD